MAVTLGRIRLPATVRTVLVGGLATVAFPLSAAITSPILARGLGPAGRGELAALLTPLMVAEALAAVGTPLAAAYFVRAGADFRSLRRAGLWIVSCSGVGTAAVFLLSADALLSEYPHLVASFRWLALSVVAAAYIELYRGIRSGQEDYRRVNANYWFGAVGRLIGIVVLALADALTPTRVAVLSIATGLLAGLTLVRLRGAPTGPLPEEAPERLTSGGVLRFSLRTWAGVVSTSIGSRLDQFLLIGLVSPRVLGVYAVAATAAQVPMAFFPAVQRVLLNKAAAHRSPQAVLRASQVSVAVALGTVVLLEPLLPPLVRLVFGRGFEDAAGLAQILIVGAALWGIGLSLSGLLIGVGRPGDASLADGAGTVVLAAALVPLHAVLGVHGAALAVVLGAAVATVGKAALLARREGLSTAALLWPSPRAVAGLVTIADRRTGASRD